MRLLIAVPVYNEFKYVARVLDRIMQFHPDVLAIDDGSSDRTCEVLACRRDLHLIRHPRNYGYGQSLIDGFAYAAAHGYDWVITMDCDEQHEPQMIPEFVREIKTDRWDIVSGSRYAAPSAGDDQPPTDRRSINADITRLIVERLGLPMTDAFCGYKAHRVAAMQKISLDVVGYAFPMQLWPQVAAAKLRFTELPVPRIYNDPNRYFGGNLDDAAVRRAHYLEVFNRELRRAGLA